MALEILLPGRILFGNGSRRSVGDVLRSSGVNHCLVVTDPGVRVIDGFADIMDALGEAGVSASVFDGVVPNPTYENVRAAMEVGTSRQVQAVVGVGGGSALDVAKVAAALMTNPGGPGDYVGYEKFRNPPMPVVAVPTTAGTGSEVTQWAVLTDMTARRKLAFGGRYVLAAVAVVDPELTHSLPAHLTAQTGMDALTHAVEALVATNASPLTDAIALGAIRQLCQWLSIAYAVPGNAEARERVMWGQMAAGLAFSNAAVGAVHALAHQLGALYDLPHGLANAILLPYVLEFNLLAAQEKLALAAAQTGVDLPGSSPLRAGSAFVGFVRNLCGMLGIPGCLREVGVQEPDIPRLAAMAEVDLAVRFNPRPLSRDALEALYRRAF